MAAWSPTLEGFRAIFRRPSVPLAEVLWRWSFGAAALILLSFGLLEYFDTLPVSNGDLIFLRSGQPVLISQALGRIFQGTSLRFILAAIIVVAALAILWIFLASIGRSATVDDLVKYIGERARAVLAASTSGQQASTEQALAAPGSGRWHFRSMAALHFLRAGLGLAATIAFFAVIIFAPLVSTKDHMHPAIVFFLTLVFLFAVWLIWSSVSWFLSLASIFVVRNRESAFSALSSAATFCSTRGGPVALMGTWFGLTHVVLFFVATSAIAFPLSLATVLPLGAVVLVIAALTLAYFAMVDTLYVARLAGYVAILEAPPIVPEPPLPLARPEPPGTLIESEQAGVASSESATVDQDELILGDPGSSMVDQNELILGDSGNADSGGSVRDEAPPTSQEQ
jgi:hypothetical protein